MSEGSINGRERRKTKVSAVNGFILVGGGDEGCTGEFGTIGGEPPPATWEARGMAHYLFLLLGSAGSLRYARLPAEQRRHLPIALGP